MTPKISLVAVCCSNDSLSSWNNRTFSMAMTAWSAKVSSSLICAGVKGRTSDATCVQVSNEFPLLTKGNGQVGAPSAGGTHHWEIVLRANVGNVERAVLAHPAKLWLINTDLDAAERVWDQNGPAESIVFPSWSRSTTSSIPQTRAALSTMASSTGCTSVGERLMMPSTSAVAV